MNIFPKTLARKKISFAISEKTLAETVHYIPKGLRKGNPFHGPFAQLSIYIFTLNFSPKNPDPIRCRIDVLNIFSVNKNPTATKTCTFSPCSSTAAAKVATFLPTNKTQTSQNTSGIWDDFPPHKVGPKNQL